MRHFLALPLVFAVALAGCGSQGKPDPLGVAAGQAFVRVYSPVKDKSAYTLAQDFQTWSAGKLATASVQGSPPGSRLSASEHRAAAGVVLAYARHLVGIGQLPATLPGGENLLAYLKARGVN
jgi:hypothetical protein